MSQEGHVVYSLMMSVCRKHHVWGNEGLDVSVRDNTQTHTPQRLTHTPCVYCSLSGLITSLVGCECESEFKWMFYCWTSCFLSEKLNVYVFTQAHKSVNVTRHRHEWNFALHPSRKNACVQTVCQVLSRTTEDRFSKRFNQNCEKNQLTWIIIFTSGPTDPLYLVSSKPLRKWNLFTCGTNHLP